MRRSPAGSTNRSLAAFGKLQHIQNERYFVAVHPTAHSLACLRIGVFVTADAARLAPGVGGSPFTGRVSHPLDGEQSFHDVTASSLPFDQPCLVAPCTNASILGVDRPAFRQRDSTLQSVRAMNGATNLENPGKIGGQERPPCQTVSCSPLH